MNKRIWIVVAVFVLLFVVCLGYGIYLGDPGYVFANAAAVCYT